MRVRLIKNCHAGARLLAAATLCASLVLIPQAAVAEEGKDDRAAERAQAATSTRQGALKLLGFYMGPLGGMARGLLPMDADLVARNAQRIGSLAPMLTDTFKFDTSKSDVVTEALPVIWEDSAAFQSKIETLVERAADLSRLASSSSAEVAEGALKGGIAKLGQACGSCHDDFRVKKDG